MNNLITNPWQNIGLVLLLMAVSFFSTNLIDHPNKFAMMGVLCSLLVLPKRGLTFLAVFIFSGLLNTFSYIGAPFESLLLILASEALLTIWYFHLVDWSRPRSGEDLGILLSMSLSIIMFFVTDLGFFSREITQYLLYSCFLFKPLLWIAPKLLEDEVHRLEYISSVLTIVAFSYVHRPESSLEFSLVAALAATILTFVGSSLVAPVLIFFSLLHLFPDLQIFSGAMVYAVFYQGWPLRVILVALVGGFALQFNAGQEIYFWVASLLASVNSAVLFFRVKVGLKDIKEQLAATLLGLFLIILPMYFNFASLTPDLSLFEGTTSIIPVLFILLILALKFLVKKEFGPLNLPIGSWNSLMSYLQTPWITKQERGSSLARMAESSNLSHNELPRNHVQVMIWLLAVATVLWVIGGIPWQ